MRFVVLGPMPTFTASHDFPINKARRGEFPPSPITLRQLASLGVASDSGDDASQVDKAAELIRSWAAGGALPCKVDERGRPTFTPADALKARENFEGGGIWGEGVQRWCDVWGVAEVPANVPSENTHMRQEDFKNSIGGKFKGNLGSVCKNWNRKDSPSPYRDAFNENGSVNEHRFIEIAKSRGEWNEGASTQHLRAVASALTTPSKTTKR